MNRPSLLHPDPRQTLRYSVLSLVSLGAIGVGDVILRYTYSLYLSFQPASFLREGHLLLAAVGLFGALGGWLDRADSAERLTTRLTRALLLTLVLVALFQVFRQSLATQLPLPGWAKAAALLGCAGAACVIAWRMGAEPVKRIGNAACLSMVTLFALQPGMAGYLLHALSPEVRQAPPAAASLPAARRTIVIVFDEWDMEISEREELFEREPLRSVRQQAFFAENALPAGPNTLESIPGMIFGRPFGDIERGGVAQLRSKTGQTWNPDSAQLFSDLKSRGIGHAVIGYYHDYCALITTARTCHAEPVQFFQGWKSQLERLFKRSGQFDFPYSVFLQQWHATYARLHAEALKAVDDPANGLVWIHINIPHPPSAVPRRAPRDLLQDYQANLELTAELIDAVRQRLVTQGTPATLVLTSDHWLRERELWAAMYEQQRGPGSGDAGKTSDHRVPLIVWFSAASQAVSHEPQVSTLALRSLILELVEGGIRTPQDIEAFFRRQPPAIPPRSDGTSVH